MGRKPISSSKQRKQQRHKGHQRRQKPNKQRQAMNMPSGSYGGFSRPWQNGPGVLEVRRPMKEPLKNIFDEGSPNCTINDFNSALMSSATSILNDDEFFDLGIDVFDSVTNDAHSDFHYYGESSQLTTHHLQTNDMFSIPDAGTTTTMQNQPQNYSQLEQMPNFSGGNTYAPSGFHGASLQDFGQQAYKNQGGMNYNFSMETFQGNNLQGTIQYIASALQSSYLYAPTGQPSMDQRSYETLRPTINNPTRIKGHPHLKGVSASQATVCESSKCAYCGKHPLLVEFFLKRNEKTFRKEYPKLCEKMDYLSQHLKKCNNQSCGCSIFRPYYQHSHCLLNGGLKKRSVSAPKRGAHTKRPAC